MEAELEQDKVDSVRYGMEIILGSLIKGIVLLALAYLLGILPQAMVALICGSLLRLVSGGAHCTSYLRCLSCGSVVYLSIGKAALYFESFLSHDQLAIILTPGFIIMVISAFLWAPAEVPYRVIGYRESILFKGLTVSYIIIWLTLIFYYEDGIRLSYVMAGLLALLAQTFSFTPPGYLVIGKIDAFLLYLTSKKGGALNNVET